MYILHEDFLFDNDKFNELLYSIKMMKKHRIGLEFINKSFIFNLFDRISYLYWILRDISIKQYELSIDEYEYYNYLL